MHIPGFYSTFNLFDYIKEDATSLGLRLWRAMGGRQWRSFFRIPIGATLLASGTDDDEDAGQQESRNGWAWSP